MEKSIPIKIHNATHKVRYFSKNPSFSFIFLILKFCCLAKYCGIGVAMLGAPLPRGLTERPFAGHGPAGIRIKADGVNRGGLVYVEYECTLGIALVRGVIRDVNLCFVIAVRECRGSTVQRNRDLDLVPYPLDSPFPGLFFQTFQPLAAVGTGGEGRARPPPGYRCPILPAFYPAIGRL